MLNYQYHDALLESIETGPQAVLVLQFFLYPVFYARPSRVQVRMEGVFNLDALQAYFAPMWAEQAADSDIDCLASCLAFHADTQRKSGEQSCHLFLKLQHYGSLRIHCRDVTETLLDADAI